MKTIRGCCQLIIILSLLIKPAFGQDLSVKIEDRSIPAELQLPDSLLGIRAYEEANLAIDQVIDQIHEEADMHLLIAALELKARIIRRVDAKGWEASIPIINRAVALARENLETEDILLARVYQTQARAYHFSREYFTARAAIDTSMMLYQLATSTDSSLYESIIDFKYYTYYYSDGSKDTLLKYVNQRYQRELRKMDRDPEEILYIMQDFPDMYADIGDFEKALTYAIQGYKYAEENKESILKSSDGFETYANTFKNLMDVLLSRRDYEEALKMGQRILEAMEENNIQVSDYVEYYGVLANIGRAYSQMSRYEEAFVFFNQALDIDTRSPSNAIFYARMKLFIGDCLINLSRTEEGELAFREGLEILKENIERPSPAFHVSYDAFGDYYSDVQAYKKALLHYDSALMNSMPNNSNQWYEFPQDSTQDLGLDQILTIANKASLFDKIQNDSISSSVLYKYGLSYAEQLHRTLLSRRQEFEASEGKLFLSERFRFIYESALNFAYKLYQENPDQDYFLEALKFSRRSKSILFLEQANEYEKVSNNIIDSDLKASFNSYKKNLDQLEGVFYRLIDDDVTSDSIIVLNDSLVSLRMNLGAVLDTIEQELNAVNWEGLDKIFDQGLERIETEKGTIKYEFFYGTHHVYVLTIGPNANHFYRLAIKGEFESKLEQVINYVSRPPILETFYEDQNKFALDAQYLYEKLIAPGIQESMGVEKIVIIPDQFLSRLPFEALVSSYDEEMGLSSEDYLINRFDVRYELSSLLADENSAKATKNSVLGLGFASTQSSSNYGNLPGTEREINFLKASYQGTFINSATKDQFLNLSRDYDIIHLAVHGKSDSINKYESSLVFSSGRDNELKTSDLYLAGLNARLAILSACESGVGMLNKGEGTFSIARGFSLSGVPSVVMSLWKVNDGVTAKLMEQMYENFIDEGYPINKALEYSKRNFLNQADSYFSHPFYWASFIHLGEDVSFDEHSQKSYFLWAGFLLLAMVILLLSKKKRI